MNNKNKNYIICGCLCFLLIIAIVFFISSLRDKPNPNIPDNVEETNPIDDIYLENIDKVTPSLYSTWKLRGDSIVRSISDFMSDYLTNDDVTKTYKHLIGTEFVSELTLSSASEKDIPIPNTKDKIFVFHTYDSEDVKSELETFLYLAAKAKETDLYDVYVVNTNPNTMQESLSEDVGYVYNKTTEEMSKFLQDLPDDFIVFVDDQNIIEFICSIKSAYTASGLASYIFETSVPAYKVLSEIEKYMEDPRAAALEYLGVSDKPTKTKVDSIFELNENNGYHFYTLDTVDFADLMNNKTLFIDEMYIDNDILTCKAVDANTNGITYVFQTQNPTTKLIDDGKYSYGGELTVGNTLVNIYGIDKEHINAFIFEKSNIYFGIEAENTVFTTTEVEAIVNNY